MPSPISSESQLVANLNRFWQGADLANSRHGDFLDLLKRGRNFVCDPTRTRMAPSRFVGYVGNSLAKHANLEYRNGGVTDAAISQILREPVEDARAEAAYRRICERFRITPPRYQRTYWVLNSETLDSIRAALEETVRDAANMDSDARRERLRNAPKKPRLQSATVLLFVRNADVVAEVLLRAHGICELCGSPAPFNRASDGTPYLEVHHKIRLADDGDDTVDNALAVCPNCHRRQHFG